ncbi:MAG: hypothetical protein WB952_06230 [Terriglobales bacterium]
MPPSESSTSSSRNELRQIAEEIDRLLQRQIELMKSESFVGLTPAERTEYDRIGERISALFGDLAKFK